MRHFFALPALLRSAAVLASASRQSFSVQDDLLAFPQYEVRFIDEWTHESEVESRLASSGKPKTQGQTDDAAKMEAEMEQYQRPLEASEHAEHDGGKNDAVEYEHMVLEGQRWLCRIPKVKRLEDSIGVNETLTRAEEERELARANERGWELLSGMQGNCVFFISGWWSYSFCYNQGVRQFHQMTPSRGVPVYPPMEDPSVPGFVLGSYSKLLENDAAGKERDWDGDSALDMSEGAKRKHSKHGELVQRGESRYLVQKLGGGTICDLTGKERKIEVQFHCNPQASDRIALIKETSICAYLMVIQTPRLCNDVAFLPPQKDRPNTISCSPVLRDDEIDDYERDIKEARAADEEDMAWETTAVLDGPVYDALVHPVGDLFVGGRKFVPEGVKIEKSAIVGGGKETYVDTIAYADGRAISKPTLEKLGIGDSKAIDKLKKELEKHAEGQNWKLDVVDTPRGREYRAVIGDDEEEGEEEAAGQGGASKKKEGSKLKDSKAPVDSKKDDIVGKLQIEKKEKKVDKGNKDFTDKKDTKETKGRTEKTEKAAKMVKVEKEEQNKKPAKQEQKKHQGSEEEYYKGEL